MEKGWLGARVGWAGGEEANIHEFAEKICECIWVTVRTNRLLELTSNVLAESDDDDESENINTSHRMLRLLKYDPFSSVGGTSPVPLAAKALATFPGTMQMFLTQSSHSTPRTILSFCEDELTAVYRRSTGYSTTRRCMIRIA